MSPELKTCQNCKAGFVIEPDDFEFYEKISSRGGPVSGWKVPPPTWCPGCRLQRRYAFRNETNLYRVKCGLCGEMTVSMYSADKLYPIYCQKCWMSDGWDPLVYGREYDSSRPFFEQFGKLLQIVPRVGLFNRNPVNSEYCNYAIDNKNCYMCFSIGGCEDSYFCGPQNVNNKNLVSSSMARFNEAGSDLIDCEKCYKTSFSQNCVACLDSQFLLNCRNCQGCLGCVNARNKNYHILNRPYSREEYFKKVEELDLGSYKKLLAFRKDFEKLIEQNIHKFATIENSVNVTGDNLLNSKNCHQTFAANNAENCKYCFILNGNKECYDVNNSYPSAELSYESVSLVEGTRCFFTSLLWSSSLDSYYSDGCFTVENVFGCVSLKKKSFCILNKQYGPEEYRRMIEKIKKQMTEIPYRDRREREYRWGEFFPAEISPFAYNETVAQQYFPLSKEKALDSGFSWKEPENKYHAVTIKSQDLPDHIKDVSDSILGEVIECEHGRECLENCTGAFRVVGPELALYRQLRIPLPRFCSNCRNYQRVAKRNPIKLWTRVCQCAGANSENKVYRNQTPHFHKDAHCPNEFETSYAPERKEIVYCESCYNREII